MLIVTALNVTEPGRLAREDGTADYVVEVAINHAPPIWAGEIRGHVRNEGAAKLLRLIADKIEQSENDGINQRNPIQS